MSRAIATAALALVAAALACTGGEDRDAARQVTALPAAESGAAAQGAPLDEALMVPLAQARNHHHKADVLLEEGRLPDAIAALRPILALRFPAGAAEGEDVLLDARARLAKLLVKRGGRAELDEALAVVDQGLAGGPRPSFFLANLYTARGEVLEASARLLDLALDSVPSTEAAREARRAAVEAFDRSIAINEDLMRGLEEDAR
jgi:hypothetical protein